MITAIVVGIMFGVSSGFSPGPLLTLVVSQTVQHSAREGALVAATPILTDAPIILLSYFILKELATIEPVLGAIAAAGGIYVLYLSYDTFTTRPAQVEPSLIQPRSIRKGMLVNALNPHPYLFWTTVGVPFMLKAYQSSGAAPWLFISCFYCFLIGSKIFTAIVVDRFRALFEGKIFLYLMRMLGMVLCGFGMFLLWEAIDYLLLNP